MNYDLNVFRFADKDGPWKIQEIPAAVSDIAKKGKTGDEKIYFDFTMFAWILLNRSICPTVFPPSFSFFQFLFFPIYRFTWPIIRSTSIFYLEKEREKKEIWESRVKTSFDVDALKIGSLINIGKWGISSW